MQTITYGCTALVGTNKVGELSRDKNGYYEMVLGALQAFNSAGQFYPLEDAKQLFEGNSTLMRRIRNGALRGEVGHPRFQEGMSEKAWFARVNDLYEPNFCCHHMEVGLSYDTVRDPQGRPVVAVMGKVKPSGANERFLERQLDNPKENVCFSIRSFTNDRMEGGIVRKYLKHIVTWDYVNEPGIAVANKYSSPTLESYQGVAELDAFDFRLDTVLSQAQVEQKSGVSMESCSTAGDLLTMFGYVEPKIKVYVPATFAW